MRSSSAGGIVLCLVLGCVSASQNNSVTFLTDVLWTYTRNDNMQSNAVNDNGIVYFSGGVFARVYARKLLTGEKVWTFSDPDNSTSLVSPYLVVDSGVVVAGDDEGTYFGLNASSGAPLWKYQVAPCDEVACRDVSVDRRTSTVFLTGYQVHVTALDINTGKVKWQQRTHSSTEQGAPAVVESHGSILVPSWVDLYSFDIETGHINFVLNLTQNIGQGPTVIDDVAYVGVHPNNVIAVEGGRAEVKWNITVNEGTDAPRSPSVNTVGCGHVLRFQPPPFVYATSQIGLLYALNKEDGSVAWVVNTTFGVLLVPPLYFDGIVYVPFGARYSVAAFDAFTGDYLFRHFFSDEIQWIDPVCVAPAMDDAAAAEDSPVRKTWYLAVTSGEAFTTRSTLSIVRITKQSAA